MNQPQPPGNQRFRRKVKSQLARDESKDAYLDKQFKDLEQLGINPITVSGNQKMDGGKKEEDKDKEGQKEQGDQDKEKQDLQDKVGEPLQERPPGEEQEGENEEKNKEEEEEKDKEKEAEDEEKNEEETEEAQEEENKEKTLEERADEHFQESDLQERKKCIKCGKEAEKTTRLGPICKRCLEKAKKKYINAQKRKEAAKKAWNWIIKVLAKNPYFWAAIIIVILLMVLASGCSRESGKTPVQKLQKGTDDQTVLQFLAASGEAGAQNELVAKQAMAAKEETKKTTTANPEAQKLIKQIQAYLDEIITLTGNPDAVQDRINQIKGLLDQLSKISGLDDYIAKIKQQIEAIPKMISFYERGHLVVNPKDIDYARNYELDRRIVKMLVYLVTPTDQGGAGHERIKVKRIMFGYDTDRKAASKETDFGDQEEPNISAHFSGQAADITEIDNIKCTQIKRRRVLKDKKKKLPPIPIKVAWQTEEGYAKAGGPEAFGQNMHDLFKNLGSGSVNEFLIAEIADALGIDIDIDKLEGKSWGEITRYIGMAYLKEQLDIPGNYELGSDFDDISRNIGRAYLAEALGVPIEGIQGNSPAEIEENVGRAIAEEHLGLAAGSLLGNTTDEIFSNAGRRKIEESLNISRDSLNVPYSDTNGFEHAVGQGRIEKSLGIKPQTFYGTNLDDLKKRLTKELFDVTFSDPETIDTWLGIADGSTDNLISGKISPDQYDSIVGDKVIEKELDIYKKQDKRAEAFDISIGDLQAMVNGNKASFVGMGKYTIAKGLTASDPERDLLINWFNTKSKPANLDADYIGSQVGLRQGDVEKMFVLNLAKEVFRRLGKVEILNNIEENPQIAQYMDPIKEARFYTDRLNIIADNFQAIKNNSSNDEIKAKAQESENIVKDLLSNLSVDNIKEKTKKLQENMKFIQDKAAKDDGRTIERIKAIEKAINEIIEGRELNDYDTYSAGSISSRTDPQIGLTKKDVIAILMGKKTLEETIVKVGVTKWEIELDLPAGSLTETYKELKGGDFSSTDEVLLVSIGKSKVKEYGGVSRGDADQVDRDLNLPKGTTADFRAKKITENAYYKKVGLGVTNNIAAKLLNKQLGLNGDLFYALDGQDITKMLSGGWFWVVLKIGGRAVDEALDFPPGGTLDIIKQSNKPGDVLSLIAEKKLGMLAGLDRPISLDGDITYNLGLAKIEQAMSLKRGELKEDNLVAKIKDYAGTNRDSQSLLDVTLGVAGGDTNKLISGGMSSHDYILKVGRHIKDSVVYDFIAQYAPDIAKNRDIKSMVLALAEKTGTPEEIMQGAGANRLGEMLGLDVPVSIRGNLKDNIGSAAVEDRLGLKPGTFKESFDKVIELNSQDKVEAAFHIQHGELSNARQSGRDYWTDDTRNSVKLIDAQLNIEYGSTFDLITGRIEIADYISRVGKSMLLGVTTEKLADLMGVDDKYADGIKTVVNLLQEDPSLSSSGSKRDLYKALVNMTGLDLDGKMGFSPGTFEKIFFIDPNDPTHTGLKNADYVLLEEGKKYVPKMLGLGEEWDPYIDIIYEQVSGLRDEERMKDAIKEITGIPDDTDAYRLLKGDLKGGLYAWGASQIVKNYNEEFAGTDSKLDYYTVRNAFFNTPEFDQKVGDEAVEKFKKECGGCEISPEVEKTVREDAIHEAKTKLKNDVQYAIIDIQLHSLDKNIPPGFTKAMREGTPEDKWTMGLSYIGNMLHSENSNIPPEILNDLKKYFDPDSPTFHDPKALSDSTYAFLDTEMKTWFGSFIQPGTAKALFEYGKTGKLGSPSDKGSLTEIYSSYGINIICNWADLKMGLPAGTTKLIYEYYTKFQSAIAEYKAAQAAFEAGKITQEALAAKAAAVNAIKAEFVSFVITKVFSHQLRDMEEKIGLVPGSADLLVMAAVQFYFMNPAGAIMYLAVFVVWNLLGVYRVDVICTACGYYPETENRLGLTLTGASGQSCPLGEFDGTDTNAFKQGTIKAAQYKVNQLVSEVIDMPNKMKDETMLPTQIMTLRQEDVDAFGSQLDTAYGPAGRRGRSGLWANQLMWDHIHIGY